ncbi:sporangiospore maturation cell wall hydrolase GsmA [Actinoplanes sp. KI2]|uniref:sporangiospore maturation cell wall hydrolase GsmA n=1 Tax=Actinoplanes sp. KI2 TaxID=2983315 RepID=UPI0021D5AFB5|nr:sporangiospore maturation cell wall hydrolase GsmA [Actinoplanes sp. KI2]MCU7726636.1 sporangiospore maturation cell wall hydrolase GsmA [Actinoplanes sp. KI2]
MGRRTRRLIAVPMMALTAGAGLMVVASPAQAAGTTAVVKANSPLKTRSGPSLASRITGSLRNGQKITAVCRVTGQSVRGSVRTTSQWDRLSNNSYVTHAYLQIGRTLPLCATKKPVAAKPAPVAGAAYTIGTVRSTDGAVNVRTGPGTSFPLKRTVLNGAKVQGVCGVVGQSVNGTVRSTTQWNRLGDGGYISHAYVVTPTLHLCPGASLTPVVAPEITPEQFLAAAVPGAQAGWRQYGVPASVTIAQAILESGWGKSGLSLTDGNYFGIKCQNGKYGTIAKGCHVYNTSECDKAGKCFGTTASFRIYATMADSFRDHGNFLRVNSRYQPAFSYTKDANKFIWQVWKAGYATDPNYFTKITGLMASRNLYQYDIWK